MGSTETDKYHYSLVLGTKSEKMVKKGKNLPVFDMRI